MNQKLRSEAQQIIEYAIGKSLPDRAVTDALAKMNLSGNIYLVAIGKAAWQMANAAVGCLKQPPTDGIVLTKYGHAQGPVPGVRCFEGGHPIVDENGLAGTQAILDMTAHLTAQDRVLLLISGGGSALFEKPLVSLPVLQEFNRQLLAAGASITEINIVRKRLSAVKGGRFAKWCEPAPVDCIILSDVLGDAVDMIASGPAAPDRSTCEDALAVVEKYGLDVTEEVFVCLRRETPKRLGQVSYHVIGSVAQLCAAAAEKCRDLGYETHILTDQMCCEAREAGLFLASLALDGQLSGGREVLLRDVQLTGGREALLRDGRPSTGKTSSVGSGPFQGKRAYIAGGECVVHLRGTGMGGRNQELALAAAQGLAGISNAALFSVGSDGTDGPTDAAGGYVDGDTLAALTAQGIRVRDVLANNDSYHALDAVGGLLKTGPTGTNVNDFAVLLIDK